MRPRRPRGWPPAAARPARSPSLSLLSVFARQDDAGHGMRQPPVAAPREQGHAGGRSRSGSGTMRVRAVLLAAMLLAAAGLPATPARTETVVRWGAAGAPVTFDPHSGY